MMRYLTPTHIYRLSFIGYRLSFLWLTFTVYRVSFNGLLLSVSVYRLRCRVRNARYCMCCTKKAPNPHPRSVRSEIIILPMALRLDIFGISAFNHRLYSSVYRSSFFDKNIIFPDSCNKN